MSNDETKAGSRLKAGRFSAYPPADSMAWAMIEMTRELLKAEDLKSTDTAVMGVLCELAASQILEVHFRAVEGGEARTFNDEALLLKKVRFMLAQKAQTRRATGYAKAMLAFWDRLMPFRLAGWIREPDTTESSDEARKKITRVVRKP